MLEKIKSPKDVHRLSYRDLIQLTEDIRKRIIEVTSKNGGHLAPSLGATDLCVALLKVFDPMIDRIIWDVGHQAYAFKILTERNDRFDTLRQYEGISGFNNIFESPYDAFGVGHSSTSISSALGICVAKDYLREQGRTIAIIGDGALTGGMSFEAINHTGHLQKNLIVILNDNGISISRNVGALQNYLTNMLTSRSYNFLKKQVWDLSASLPENIRKKFILGARKLEESFINILVPNIIFEDLGFKYVGPINGHDIPRMVSILQKVKTNMVGPVLIHVVTQKGKGCDFAENKPTKYHGVSPFNEETGLAKSPGKITYSSLLGKNLTELAKDNKKIVAITAAMSEGTGLTEFEKKYPDRFFDVGIAEQHAVTFAAGLAKQGLKPIVAIYSTFMQRALDQVIHDVALQKLPVVFCMDRAGLVGEDGATHHGAFDLSFMNLIPNMVIMAPDSAEDFKEMLSFAVSYQAGPVAIRYPRGEALFLNEEVPEIELGKSRLLKEGKKVCILAVGATRNLAFEVAEKLSESVPGLEPEIIDPRFIKPLDLEMLHRLEGSMDLIITLEENAIVGGFGSSIKNYFCNSKAKVLNFGFHDKFIPHGSNKQLFDLIGYNCETIVKDILAIYDK